jgi:hypothetical protein
MGISSEEMDDLDLVNTTNEQAVESTPVNYPDCAVWRNNLGNAPRSRFEITGSMNDLDRAIVEKEQAFESDIAPPSIRLKAASSCSDLFIN